MKVTYAQLEAHLTKQLAPIYIASGDEFMQKQDVFNWLRKAAKKAGFTERTRITPEAGFDWEQLFSLLYSRSMFADKRLIELDFRDSTPNKAASAILKEYAENPAPDALILIDIGRIDDKISKSAWYKALDKIGVTIPLWPIAREQLPQWIMQRARKYKMTMQPEAARLLADYIEGNLVAAAQTIEKIYLLQPKQAVDVEFLQAVLTDESRYTVFDFVDSLIAGTASRALHILDALKAEGTEPVLLLWSITRELRLLAECAQHIAQGQPFDQFTQKHRIFPRRQPLIRQFLNRHTANDCWQLLTESFDIDRMIKGATEGHVWDRLQLFCLRF